MARGEILESWNQIMEKSTLLYAYMLYRNHYCTGCVAAQFSHVARFCSVGIRITASWATLGAVVSRSFSSSFSFIGLALLLVSTTCILLSYLVLIRNDLLLRHDEYCPDSITLTLLLNLEASEPLYCRKDMARWEILKLKPNGEATAL